jgi:hypothetical protein
MTSHFVMVSLVKPFSGKPTKPFSNKPPLYASTVLSMTPHFVMVSLSNHSPTNPAALCFDDVHDA